MSIKYVLKTNPLLVGLKEYSDFVLWELKGSAGGTPHLYKQKVLAHFAQKYHLPILVETGTYLGEMVYAMRRVFKRIYSIELAEVFYQLAAKRFKNYPTVSIIRGNSAEILPGLLPSLGQSILFWLDGHYSGGQTARGNSDSPVMEEVRIILSQMKQSFCILIDDARLFVGKDGYPTLEELNGYIGQTKPGLKMEVEKDIIRIFPK